MDWGNSPAERIDADIVRRAAMRADINHDAELGISIMRERTDGALDVLAERLDMVINMTRTQIELLDGAATEIPVETYTRFLWRNSVDNIISNLKCVREKCYSVQCDIRRK